MLTLSTPPKRILVIHVARFGDTLLTGVAIRALKQAYPDAEIDFLGHPKRYDIIRGLPELRTLARFPKRARPSKVGAANSLAENLMTWRLSGGMMPRSIAMPSASQRI
jgi:ADP-heptose:LPS heptosyltransferase